MEEVVEEVVYGEPDPVEPFKEEIDIDYFGGLDLRVCQIVKAADIRKSANCLKLTLEVSLWTLQGFFGAGGTDSRPAAPDTPPLAART